MNDDGLKPRPSRRGAVTRDLEPAAVKAAAQLIDPSGIFGLTWQECMERAEAIIRAYLSALSEPAAPAGAEEPQSNAIAWLLGCLHHANPTDDSQWHVRPGRHAEFSKAVWAVVSATPQPVEPPDDSLNDIAAGNEAARDDEWGEAVE